MDQQPLFPQFPQDDTDGKIELDASKTYTMKDAAEIVHTAVRFIGQQHEHSELRFSNWDMYWMLQDLLRYVNRQIEGEFTLKSLKKGTWRVVYSTETTAKRRADEKDRRAKRRTADYLEQLTGRRPPWG